MSIRDLRVVLLVADIFLCGGAAAASIPAGTPQHGTVTVNITVDLKPGIGTGNLVNTAECTLTLYSNDPNDLTAASTVPATYNGNTVTCAPLASYYWTSSSAKPSLKVSYTVSLESENLDASYSIRDTTVTLGTIQLPTSAALSLTSRTVM